MPASEVILSVDYGTSNTVAVLQRGAGRAEPLLFDGAPLLPSAVWLGDTDDLLTGQDALHTARLDPARFEPNPKRHVDEQILLLGSTEVPVVDAVTAVLSRVRAEAIRTAGAPPDRLRMTHPAQWGTARKQVLVDAAGKAGLPAPALVAEPVAAAVYFTQILHSPVKPGGHVVVFDFGGGTLDVAIVARTDDGFDVVAVDGRGDLGGLDVDAMVIDCIADGLPDDAQIAWQQLMAPTTPQQRRAARVLWEDARTAKEMLSRQMSAPVQVPLLDHDVHVTRGELETKASPRLTEAAALTAALMRRADIGPYGTGLFLVGGASRIPLVATTLLRATHVNPTALDRPELVVATGAITAPATRLTVTALNPTAAAATTPQPDGRSRPATSGTPFRSRAARPAPRRVTLPPQNLDIIAPRRRRWPLIAGLTTAAIIAGGFLLSRALAGADGPYMTTPNACEIIRADSAITDTFGEGTRTPSGTGSTSICTIAQPHARSSAAEPDRPSAKIKIERLGHHGMVSASTVAKDTVSERRNGITPHSAEDGAYWFGIDELEGYTSSSENGKSGTAASPKDNLVITVVVTYRTKQVDPASLAQSLVTFLLDDVGKP